MADVSKKTVIGELLNTGDEQTKKVIGSYNFSASYKANLAALKSHKSTSLEACAVYLGFAPRSVQDNKKLYKNLAVLCDRIILKIESLFDIHCDACSNIYRNKLTDDPPLKCQLCLQGCHSCPGMVTQIDAYKKMCDDNLCPSGTVWMCHECKKKNDLSLVPKNAPSSLKEPNVPAIEEEAEEEDDGVKESPRRGREKDNEPPKHSQHNKQNICEAYTKMKCPHGLTGKRLIDGKRCPKDHVPRCRRYCGFGENTREGCKFGEKCRFYHPKLCRNSVSKRSCQNPDCTFVHLKFTKRPNTKSQQQDPRDIHRNNQSVYKDGDRGNKDNYRPNIPVSKNPLNTRFNSSGSIYTPYPPTIDIRNRRARSDSQCEKDPKDTSAFLEKLLENMKDGILLQMENKLTELRTELRNEIPEIILESARWNEGNEMPSRPSSHPQMIQHPLLAAYKPPYPFIPSLQASNMMYQQNKPTQPSQLIQMPNNNLNCQNYSY
jgi:hypothetical protein